MYIRTVFQDNDKLFTSDSVVLADEAKLAPDARFDECGVKV
jgi:hypothetical protein